MRGKIVAVTVDNMTICFSIELHNVDGYNITTVPDFDMEVILTTVRHGQEPQEPLESAGHAGGKSRISPAACFFGFCS